MSHLTITERRENSVVILDLDGKIRLGEESAELRRVLRLLAEAGEKKILLNLTNTTYVDSSGLGELVGAFTTFKKNEGEVKLVYLPEKILELMTLTKLTTIFDIFNNEAEAVSSFDDQSPKAAYVSRLS